MGCEWILAPCRTESAWLVHADLVDFMLRQACCAVLRAGRQFAMSCQDMQASSCMQMYALNRRLLFCRQSEQCE